MIPILHALASRICGSGSLYPMLLLFVYYVHYVYAGMSRTGRRPTSISVQSSYRGQIGTRDLGMAEGEGHATSLLGVGILLCLWPIGYGVDI